MKSWYDLKYGTEMGKTIYTAEKIRWSNADPFYVGSFLEMIFTTSYWRAIKILSSVLFIRHQKACKQISVTCLLVSKILFIMMTVHLKEIRHFLTSTTNLPTQLLCRALYNLLSSVTPTAVKSLRISHAPLRCSQI
jgi:hypothetical protein